MAVNPDIFQESLSPNKQTHGPEVDQYYNAKALPFGITVKVTAGPGMFRHCALSPPA